jgi:hypothetical protein
MRNAAMRLAIGVLFIVAGLVGLSVTRANADSDTPALVAAVEVRELRTLQVYGGSDVRHLFAGRSDDRFGEPRRNDQALGCRERTGAEDATSCRLCAVCRVFAGRSDDRFGEQRQDHQAVGRGERAGAEDAARAYGICEVRGLFAGRSDDRFGKRRQDHQALGRRERTGAEDATRIATRTNAAKRSITRKMNLAAWNKEFRYDLFTHMR